MVTIAAVYGATIQSINWSFVVISQDEWNEVDFSTSPIFIGLTWIKQHFNGWKWLRATFSGLKTHSTRGWKSWIWFASRAFRAKPSVRRKTKQPAASWIDTIGFWISPWRQRNSKTSGSTVIFFLVPKFGWSANLLFCQKSWTWKKHRWNNDGMIWQVSVSTEFFSFIWPSSVHLRTIKSMSA